MLLQFFYLMIGLESERKIEDLSTRLMSGYSCSAFKVVGLMDDGVKASRKTSHTLTRLMKFVEIYFWKDFTFLAINHQLDPKDVISAIHNFHSKHEKSILAYSEVLLFDEDNILPSQSGKITVCLLILFLYQEKLDLAFESVTQNKNEEQADEHIKRLKEVLNKCDRYVKFCLIMFELMMWSQLRRKEGTYRCHFDFILVSYLNYLFVKIQTLQQAEVLTSENKPLLEMLRSSAVSLSTFIIILVEYENQYGTQKFPIVAKLRTARFTVTCDVLAYRMVLETLHSERDLFDFQSYELLKVISRLTRTRLFRAAIQANLSTKSKKQCSTFI